MEKVLQIVVVASPGHFRDSLVAVLMTMPKVHLFLAADMQLPELLGLPPAIDILILAEGVNTRQDQIDSLARTRERYPAARWIALVDNQQQTSAARTLKIEHLLPRNTSAGELLGTLKRICLDPVVPIKRKEPQPIPLAL